MANPAARMFHVGPGGLTVVISPDALTAACVARGWTLTQLAHHAGISRPTLRAALRGSPIRPRTAWKLARALSQAAVPPGLDDLLEAC